MKLGVMGIVVMAISTNPKPTIYRNLYENTGSDLNFQSLEVASRYRDTQQMYMICEI